MWKTKEVVIGRHVPRLATATPNHCGRVRFPHALLDRKYMKIWYRAVCDEHKEMCTMFVSNPSCTSHYLSDKDVLIQKFLSDHYGCSLRLVHLDTDLDNLWDSYYEVKIMK